MILNGGRPALNSLVAGSRSSLLERMKQLMCCKHDFVQCQVPLEKKNSETLSAAAAKFMHSLNGGTGETEKVTHVLQNTEYAAV